MKWLIGIGAVMLVVHLYFTWGQRRIRRALAARAEAEGSGERRK